MRISPLLFTVGLLFMVFSVQTSLGQRVPMRFGKIDKQDLKMTYFEADSSAKALILGDFGFVDFRYDNEKGFQIQFTRHLRVKIFHMDAAHLADFKIPLHISGQVEERLSRLRARVYNMDKGREKRTRFRRKDVFKEEVNDYLTKMNFTLPDVREGTIFEVEYTITSPFLFSLPEWKFQDAYPVRVSEMRLHIPEYFTYKPLMQGFLPLDNVYRNNRQNKFTVKWEEEGFMGEVTKHSREIEYIDNIIIYQLENVPAFTTEPHMNAAINYISKIEHELLSFQWPYGGNEDFSSSWEKVNKTLLNSSSFGRLLNRSGFMKEEAAKIASTYAEPVDRVVAAYERVQQHMHGNNMAGVYAQSKNLRRAWSEGVGNVADINLLLVMLLRELNLDAEPVILSTRDHGIINPAQIMLDQFNYVVAAVRIEDKFHLMDASEKNQPWFLLPEFCLNGQGRIVSETQDSWIDLVPLNDNHTYTQTLLKVSPDGSMAVEMKKNMTNYHRLKQQREYEKFSTIEAFMDDYEAASPGIELTDMQMDNIGDWSKPLVSTYRLGIPAADPASKDVIYLNPLLHERYGSNPFRLEERQFPVDFIYPFKRTIYVQIEVPEGYAVEELPEASRFMLPDRSAVYQSGYQVNGDGNIVVNVLMDVAKPLFMAEEYPLLREFFASIVEEEARSIILKKL